MNTETIQQPAIVNEAESKAGFAAPSGSEFRTAAKVLRWGMREAQRQMDAIPWWKRAFKSANADEFQRLVVLCESEADHRTPNKADHAFGR